MLTKYIKLNVTHKLLKLNILFLLLIPFLNTNALFSENKIERIESIETEYFDNKEYDHYILGKGDLIYIEISKEIIELNRMYRINGDGEINLKRLGNIYVEGLTKNELTENINKKLGQYMYEPDVKISIQEYRNIRVNIKGEVYSPGLYTMKGSGEYSNLESIKNLNETISNNNFQELNNSPSGISTKPISTNYSNFPTIYDAIRVAGGITLNSDLANIEVIRQNSLSNGGGLKKAKINFFNFLDGKDKNTNIRLLDDDVIIINRGSKIDKNILRKAMTTNLNPKEIEVFITGRVTNKGKYSLSRSTSLNDAIEFAGGRLPVSGSITLARINGDGTTSKNKIKYRKSNISGSENNPYLSQGDIIIVGQSGFNIASSVINEVTAPISGLVSTYFLYKAFD